MKQNNDHELDYSCMFATLCDFEWIWFSEDTPSQTHLSLPGSGVGHQPQRLSLTGGPGYAVSASPGRTPTSPVQTISFKAEDVAVTVDEKEPLIDKKKDSVAIDMV